MVKYLIIFLSLFYSLQVSSCDKGLSAFSKIIDRIFGKSDDVKVAAGARVKDIQKLKKISSGASPNAAKVDALTTKVLTDEGVLDLYKGLDSSQQKYLLTLTTSENPRNLRVVKFLSKSDPAEVQAYLKELPGPGMQNITSSVAKGIPDDQIFKILNLQRKATKFSLYEKFSKVDVDLINKNIFKGLEESMNLPKGSLKINGNGLLDYPDLAKLSASQMKELESVIDKLNRFKQAANRQDLDKFARYDELFKAFDITDPALKLSLKQQALGDFVVPLRKSWEVPTIIEPVENILGVSAKYDGGQLIIRAKDVPEDKLLLLDKAIDNYRQPTSLSKNLAEQEKQRRFLQAFESPQSVRESLGARKIYAPTSSKDLNYRAPNSDLPLEGWKKIDATSLNGKTTALSQTEIDEGFKRVIYRNTKEGRSILELRAPDGKVISREMIIARDPTDPGKGVTFFSYEDGKLSSKFKASLSSKNHMSTGHGCMSCHGAIDKLTGRIISSFSPKGTLRSLGDLEHEATKGLGNATTTGIKNFEEGAGAAP